AQQRSLRAPERPARGSRRRRASPYAPDEIGRSSRAKLLHDARPMIFNGAGADAKMTPGLLVGRAGRELLQHFTLPTGQWFAPGKLQRFVFGSGIVGVAARISPDCLIEPAHDLAASRRFFDEVQRAVLDGADRLGDIALPRDHEDRRGVLLALMLFSEIETGSAGDMHVDQSVGGQQ